MFAGWDFDSTMGGLALAVFMSGLVIGFSILAAALVTWMWGTERDVAETPPWNETAKRPPLRKAA